MGFDKAHEQNKIMKVDGGVIGILGDADTLLEWLLEGPYIPEIINGSEADSEFRYQQMWHSELKNVTPTTTECDAHNNEFGTNNYQIWHPQQTKVLLLYQQLASQHVKRCYLTLYL